MWALCPPHIYAGDVVDRSNQPKILGGNSLASPMDCAQIHTFKKTDQPTFSSLL